MCVDVAVCLFFKRKENERDGILPFPFSFSFSFSLRRGSFPVGFLGGAYVRLMPLFFLFFFLGRWD